MKYFFFFSFFLVYFDVGLQAFFELQYQFLVLAIRAYERSIEPCLDDDDNNNDNDNSCNNIDDDDDAAR